MHVDDMVGNDCSARPYLGDELDVTLDVGHLLPGAYTRSLQSST